jgi:uncharacterized protein (DUF488 family)
METERVQRTIWTVGTGHRSMGELAAILRAAGVEGVADVRSYPKSHLSHFDRDQLDAHLSGLGIRYTWLGADLGGLRREGYEAYMASDRFARGLSEFVRLAQERPTAVLCAEIDPARCHRRLIAAELAKDGWLVVNLGLPDAYPERGPHQAGLPFGGEETTR